MLSNWPILGFLSYGQQLKTKAIISAKQHLLVQIKQEGQDGPGSLT